jgi:hypothetical protein
MAHRKMMQLKVEIYLGFTSSADERICIKHNEKKKRYLIFKKKIINLIYPP